MYGHMNFKGRQIRNIVRARAPANIRTSENPSLVLASSTLWLVLSASYLFCFMERKNRPLKGAYCLRTSPLKWLITESANAGLRISCNLINSADIRIQREVSYNFALTS